MGLSDCYNEMGRTTLDAVAIADQYVQNGDPLGFSIVNDDYGYGYTSLAELIETGAHPEPQHAASSARVSDGLCEGRCS